MAAERVDNVARVTIRAHQILAGLTGNHKDAIFSPVPRIASRTTSQFKPQLVSAIVSQLMQQLIAQPKVAVGIIESHLELRPGTVENVPSVDVLLDQQRNAVICTVFLQPTLAHKMINTIVLYCAKSGVCAAFWG